MAGVTTGPDQRNETEPGPDHSLEAVRRRLQLLQPSIGALLDKGERLFEEVAPHAPHPSDRSPLPFHFVQEIREVGRQPLLGELTIIIDSRRWINFFRTDPNAYPGFPVRRLWTVRPQLESGHNLKVVAMETADPRRVAEELPFDVDTSLVDKGGIVRKTVDDGTSYGGQEQYIDESSRLLDEAAAVAAEYL